MIYLRYVMLYKLSTFALYAQGHQDVTRYASNNLFLRFSSELKTLDCLIQPFSFYDIREQVDKLNDDVYLRIVIIGCVQKPGVYICSSSISNKILLSVCGLIDTGIVHDGPRSGHIDVYTAQNVVVRTGDKSQKSYEEFLEAKPENGSIYNVLAYVL